MRKLLLFAAALTAAICIIHVFAGGPSIHHGIQRSNLDQDLKAISAVIWHLVTAVIAICSISLIASAVKPNFPLELAVLLIFVSFIFLFVFYGLLFFGNLTSMPQWILFIVPCVAILMDWTRRRHV